ncbi:GNAT family N-acetyltransferase [Planosporangium thailandense]|uniref:GNAT family N-acetyltransferase n=1 Tax=Planosporangium thailandense TaxID=765197 RepID=A0ABX0XUQ4_9ACTN|nr:GNAT family N-acetyltransferase [Planosporangium thailandense]NJC69756.1 GNAT family N-acetyltransferase [Planosporangium thailandense]
MRLVTWQPDDLVHRLDDVIEVYGSAMGYHADLLQTRRGYVAAHAGRPGFRAVATLGDRGGLLGFGYGYTSTPGQWWHDQIRASLRRDNAKGWMSDCFELVELHVRPSEQGQGIGQRQLDALLSGLSHRTVLLSTPEADENVSRAWRLYRRFGFVDVLRNFYFPGDDRAFGILGLIMPPPGHLPA